MTPLLALAFLALSAQTQPTDAMPARSHTKVVEDWDALNYGMFVHFGLGTMDFDESGKKNLDSSLFNPSKLDPDQWAKVARESGMRYMVLTAKHATGHCLWPSKLTDRTVAASPVKIDVVDKFVKAARKNGLKPGLYYTIGGDAYHQPKMSPAEYEKLCVGQIEELLTGYGPIVELWLDMPWDLGPDTAGALKRIYARAKQLQPDCMVMMSQGFHDGANVDSGIPSYRGVPVPGAPPIFVWPRDLLNGERHLPKGPVHEPRVVFGGTTYFLPHETCDTLQRDWMWREDDPIKPLRKLYNLYDLCQRRRSNLLLNVGPDKTGRIRPEAAKRLKELADAIDHPEKIPENLAQGKPITASSTWGNRPQYSPELLIKAQDNMHYTRWAAADDDRRAWVQVEFGGPTEFDSAYITEMWKRVRAFEIQVPDDAGGWKAVYKGTELPVDGSTIKFPSVTASAVRFASLDSTMGPSLTDFEIYKLEKKKR
jgi:alpha-L-fucosidase